MSLTRRVFPSFDGPARTSPYFYIPPKRRWWPTLAAFAGGGICALALLGPSQPTDEAGAQQKPIAQQVRPGNSASKLRKPVIVNPHPRETEIAASSTPSAPTAPDTPAVRTPSETAVAPSSVIEPPVQSAPSAATEQQPARPRTIASAQPGNGSEPAATQVETATSAKPSAQQSTTKSSSEMDQRHIKKSRREPGTETLARDSRARENRDLTDNRNRAQPSAADAVPFAAAATAPTPEPSMAANSTTATKPSAAAAPQQVGVAELQAASAEAAIASLQQGNAGAPAATQIDAAPPTSAKFSARQSGAKSSFAFEQRRTKKQRRREPASETFARDSRERDTREWADNRDWGDNEWGWDFRGERNYRPRDYEKRASRSRDFRDRNLRGREYADHNLRDHQEERGGRGSGYRRYSDFAGDRFDNPGARWGSWGDRPAFGGGRGGWFSGGD